MADEGKEDAEKDCEGERATERKIRPPSIMINSKAILGSLSFGDGEGRVLGVFVFELIQQSHASRLWDSALIIQQRQNAVS
jgi:hypothetical protein